MTQESIRIYIRNPNVEFFHVFLQLSNTKAADNKTTLLNFLAETVEKKYPEALKFPDDLTHLDKAARSKWRKITIRAISSNIFSGLDNLVAHHPKMSVWAT
jgi:hypothetical protein